MPLFIAERIFGTVLPLIFGKPPKEKLVYYSEDTKNVPETLQVTSSAFKDGEHMPWKYGGERINGQNTSPPLELNNVPDGTDSFVLIIEDLDVPLPSPIVHTLTYNIPGSLREFPEGFFNESSNPTNQTYGKSYKGRVGYHGPAPLINHGVHRYFFEFYAMKGGSPLEADLDVNGIRPVLKERALAKGQIIGTFERTWEKYE